jgi:hypothetical protein
METIMNDPKSSFLTNPHVFQEIHKASGMPMDELFAHVGRKRKAAKEPRASDEEMATARLARLEH